MQSNESKRDRAFWTRGFIVLGALLAIGFSARPAAAAPFAYVTNAGDNTVSVIDTATNTATATVGVGTQPVSVAVSPDGKFVYVVNAVSNNVSVIATASNTVTATVGVGVGPTGVGIMPPPPGPI